ncbi:MAG TPA: sigma 54-interacting transcriptional regulator [Myxococcales bacterium]|nr:sigma 54-interacting transcriptional regulator [Myxococcales bacterium]
MNGTPAIPRSYLPKERAVPQLFRVLDCAFPLRPPDRWSLEGIREARIGRGERFLREGSTLYLGVSDASMSGSHALLRLGAEGFHVEDCGSTNGTFVNGQPVQEIPLADGDVLEMGHTHFLFRSGLPHVTLPAAEHPGLATLSPALSSAFAAVPAIARSGLPVVVGGETGTGKELLARALHDLSGRKGPFLAVNCGALAPTLLESEIFGYRRGAFTGAQEGRPGLVRAAGGGTLFLDEVADLSAAGQAALLRVLEQGEVLPLGATEAVRVDVRVVAASHVDLEEAVAAGRFRADLYARLAGSTLRLPALRHRREDLGLLIAAILRKAGAASARLTPEAGRALLRHRWPRNVRELERCLRLGLALSGGMPIDLCHLPEGVVRGAPQGPAISGLRPRKLSPAQAEKRDQLSSLLREKGGNVAAVARALGKARMQVHRWVKRYDLSLADYR